MTGNGLHQPDKNNEWEDVAISECKPANKENTYYTGFEFC
jgi:hypothetical protein